ncbi:MAG: 3-deoxy-D-manno-octulosonic acid transferase [Rhodospirillaceae bacterium]|jgi:3-deoxy-D-manno-octulosonic-acid transferase|nr:3-deoxy-D-manno-octulosonic acid transferase [Rhodospirillaceae bacterium]MBT5565607.1 3-deoxy-D-manno-octulosonic acid transferase [Rhodospirillaceae bacterium]MBT6088376.1 3-deoxy-D-manno-octulosonic acid transferase [Rhodospirillaceae bacterium]MBT6959923.1 3-deoxy-D-manno-octulosonic acid transferase [Rhodospirillaceae bacterium]MBT7449264.1 3-deoxy-D-manno-octulosonic acid transferase [Rhodospirillaceae bacterium]
MLPLYRIFTDLAAWPLRIILRLRAWRGKEEPLRLSERRGITAASRPEGKLAWCHAASVGEAIALLPIVNHLLKDPAMNVLVTTGTVTSARILAERLPDRAIHQFAPWDRRAWVNRFLDLWRPDLALRMESELWPNTLFALRDRNISSIVVNGRLSEKTARGWQRFSTTARQVMASLDLVLAQSEEFADRFRAIGARRVEVTGNVKLAAAPLPVDIEAQRALLQMMNARPVWLAASTHPGEEEIAFAAHSRLSKTVPDILTIIAPRHPDRGKAIAQSATRHGLRAACRSNDEPIDRSTSIYVADTLGELGTLFSIAPIVFMGKSLAAHGGQNPIEPCHFDCAILFGPNMENFQDIAERMIKDGMALQINTDEALAETVVRLVSNADERKTLSDAAKNMTVSAQASVTKTNSAISDLLSRPTQRSGQA